MGESAADVAADGENIAGGDQSHDAESYQDGNPRSRTFHADLGKLSMPQMTPHEHEDDSTCKHTSVDHGHDGIIVARDRAGGVAQHHQRPQFLTVFLQQQIDAQQQNEKCQKTDYDTHSDNHSGHDRKEVGRAA